MARLFISLFRWVIVISVLCSGIHYLINKKAYTFSPRDIRRIGEKYIGQHPNQCLVKIAADLRRQYHTHILPDNELQWVTISHGGMKVRMAVLHGSLTEFLTVVGSPLKTSGHTGIHWLNESCTVLTGNVQRIKDGPMLIQREDYGPGEHFKYYMGQVYLMESGEDSWYLCYGRGFVPASVPYLLADSLLSSIEPVGPVRLIIIYGKATARESVMWFQERFLYYMNKFGLNFWKK